MQDLAQGADEILPGSKSEYHVYSAADPEETGKVEKEIKR